MVVSRALKSWLLENNYASLNSTDLELSQALDGALKDGAITIEKIQAIEAHSLAIALGSLADSKSKEVDGGGSGGVTPQQVFSGAGAGAPNVKPLSKQFSTTQYTAKHAKTGESVKWHGSEMQMPSEYDYARAGALFKHRCRKAGVDVLLTDVDQQLVTEMVNKDTWCGQIDGQWSNEIAPAKIKASLLDNSATGGSFVDPAFYDRMVQQYPQLYGELLPLVEQVDVPRSSTIDSAGVGNPSVGWGTAEGTSIPLFDATGLVNQLNSTVFPVTLAMTIGRDLISDSVVDLGRILMENIGQSAAKSLDFVIASGDGTTQPQGITNASGLVNVTNTFGSTMQWGIYETMYFALPKQYRNTGMRNAFISSETTYANFHAIPVGPNDARRLAGQDGYASYTAFGKPYRVQNDLPNTTLIFGAMSRYRLYRRQGSETNIVTNSTSYTLALANQVLLILRGRFAGRVMDPAAFAIMTDAPTE